MNDKPARPFEFSVNFAMERLNQLQAITGRNDLVDPVKRVINLLVEEAVDQRQLVADLVLQTTPWYKKMFRVFR